MIKVEIFIEEDSGVVTMVIPHADNVMRERGYTEFPGSMREELDELIKKVERDRR